MGPETLDLIVTLKYNQDLWNDDRNKESPDEEDNLDIII